MRDKDDEYWDKIQQVEDGYIVRYQVKGQSISADLEREQAAWDLAQQAIKKAMRK